MKSRSSLNLLTYKIGMTDIISVGTIDMTMISWRGHMKQYMGIYEIYFYKDSKATDF